MQLEFGRLRVMPADDFEKTNWGWQLSQLQQQIGEWIELQLSHLTVAPSLDLSRLGIWLKVSAWLLLGLFVAWLGWQLRRGLTRFVGLILSLSRNAVSASDSSVADEMTVQHWVQQSQVYFGEGNYREACRCLYLAMLQQLHDTGMIPHKQSRTDKEYLKLTENLPQSQFYQTLITTHEELCFSNNEILPETFNRCQRAYRQIGR
jgi:hypothetical protein